MQLLNVHEKVKIQIAASKLLVHTNTGDGNLHLTIGVNAKLR